MDQKNQSATKLDIYELITERVIAQLEKGVIPWKTKWTSAGPPCNFSTQKPFKGINVWLLSCLGYDLNCFLTFKQVQVLGGSIIKGQHATPIVYWKWPENNDQENKNIRSKPMLRYYMVYNISQCENLPTTGIPFVTKPSNPINVCERIIDSMPQCPPIKIGIGEPYYHPLEDYISMPKLEKFDSSESFYRALFIELAHSTGHKSRLARKEIIEDSEYGTKSHAIEVLSATMASSYLISMAGFDDIKEEDNTRYINDWIYTLKGDKKLLVYAGAQSQKIIDFIIKVPDMQMSVQNMEVGHGKGNK